MQILRLIAAVALSAAVVAPAGAVAAQSSAATVAQASNMSPAQVQAAVKTALQASDLTLHQKMQIKPMVQQYQQQTANADAATKKSAQEQLLKSIYGVMTPDQQAKFKASLKASMASATTSH
jgi:Spy/CpxP family protein refolding chaperone